MRIELSGARPQALLFDLDGVLADVSQSYRRAIVETARHYGVSLGPTDIATAKAAGDANNDWILTQRLLATRGIDVALTEITACFEALYQGSNTQPGLWQVEQLMVERSLIERLAQALPLAIVTGRPRHDAERFLRHAGITSLFRVLICMEDAPRKPDPAPVQLALAQLGVTQAWMIGDTPDDIRAALAADVLPLGIVAPGDDAEQTRDALLGAGATRILGRLDELEAMLRRDPPASNRASATSQVAAGGNDE